MQKIVPHLVLLLLVLCSPAMAQEDGPPVETLSNPDIPQADSSAPPVAPSEAGVVDEHVPESAPTPVGEAAATDDEQIQGILAELDGQGDGETSLPTGFFDRSTAPTPAESILKGLFALCIVLSLIMVLLYAIRRWGKQVPLLAGASLGTVLGRIHLEKGTTLHFVRTGGRVLVVGVNNGNISTLANFDADVYDDHAEPSTGDTGDTGVVAFNPDTFLAQLQSSSQAMAGFKESDDAPEVEDDEISALRSDIHRLQRYLREESREPQD